MRITFHEHMVPKGTQPYTIIVDTIIGRVVEDNEAPAVLMSTIEDVTGNWQLNIRDHVEQYSGRITIEDK